MDTRRVRRVRLLGVDAEVLNRLSHDRRLDLPVLHQRVQRRQHDEAGVDFEEVAKYDTRMATFRDVEAENRRILDTLALSPGSRVLEIGFDDGAVFRIPFELMRVYSPSAEVQGHGPGQETLQTGKRNVSITQIEMVGHYAVQPTFSDGHDTGIYTLERLRELGREQ